MTSVLELFVNEVRTILDDGYALIEFGRDKQAKTDRPYRAQFIPDSIEIGGATNIGGKVVPGSNPVQKAKAVYEDKQTMLVRVWGSNYESTHIFFHNLLVAMRKVQSSGPRTQFSGGKWNRDPAVSKFGELLEFSVTISIPVIDEIVPLTPLTGESHVTTWQFPNGPEDTYCSS